MAIAISAAKIGMLVQTLHKDPSVLKVNAYKDSSKKKLIHRYPNGTNVGKIIKIDTENNSVQVQLNIPLRERLVIVNRSAYLDSDNLLVVPIKVVLPTNVAELKAMYVVKGKKNVLVRRSPITGTAFASVNGNQMVRITGQAKQGFTEVVTDNGNGWISTQFLTFTKPATVVTPQPTTPTTPTAPTTPADPFTPGIIYVPVEKPADLKQTILVVALASAVTWIAVKLFVKKPKTVL